MARVKDMGHPTGLPGKGVHYDGSIDGLADSVSWHRPSVTSPQLVLVMWCHRGWCRTHFLLFSLLVVECMFDLTQTTKSEPHGDSGFTSFQHEPFSKGLELQWDITGSRVWMIRDVIENGWLRRSSEFGKDRLNSNGHLHTYLIMNKWSQGHMSSYKLVLALFFCLLSTSTYAQLTCPNVSFCPLTHVHLLGLLESVL